MLVDLLQEGDGHHFGFADLLVSVANLRAWEVRNPCNAFRTGRTLSS